MRVVVIPPVVGPEQTAWHLVLDLAEASMPRWVLVGGLMVHLHLYEAGRAPRRVTTDVDSLVDVGVRSARATEEFSRRALDDLGLSLQPPGPDGVGHRFWREGGAALDVLAADFGPRSRPHRTLPPARTVEVPGGRHLLAHASPIRVQHGGRSAIILRPSLLAAIVGKWRAYAELVGRDPDRERHLDDVVALLAVLDPDEVSISDGQRRHLRRLLARLRELEGRQLPQLDLAIDTLTLLLDP